VPNLTVEQYASLRVELDLGPDRVPATLARYGVPAEGREALYAHWRVRFQIDPPLRMIFAVRYAQFLAWLKERRGSRSPDLAAVPPPAAQRPLGELGATSLGTLVLASSVTQSSAAAGAAPEPPSSPVGSGTVGLGADAAGPLLPAGLPDLTAEQYAALRVELEMKPDRVPGTLTRYGVPADGRGTLDAHWKARFKADPVLHMTFACRYAEYVEWLTANRGPSRN
jgi:hypothetical protein